LRYLRNVLLLARSHLIVSTTLMSNLAQIRTAEVKFMCNILLHKALSPSQQHLMTEVPIDLLIVDDFGLDAMDAPERRDADDIFLERHRAGSMIVVSNRGPDEFAGHLRRPAPRPERHRPLHQ
jgi:DNA replication protein DnaC